MKIEVDVHIHIHDSHTEALLREVLSKVGLLLQNQDTIMATVAENLAVAEASARANNDYEDSIIIILNAIRSEVAALKAGGTDQATATRIEALSALLAARTPVLAAAAVANTDTNPNQNNPNQNPNQNPNPNFNPNQNPNENRNPNQNQNQGPGFNPNPAPTRNAW